MTRTGVKVNELGEQITFKTYYVYVVEQGISRDENRHARHLFVWPRGINVRREHWRCGRRNRPEYRQKRRSGNNPQSTGAGAIGERTMQLARFSIKRRVTISMISRRGVRHF